MSHRILKALLVGLGGYLITVLSYMGYFSLAAPSGSFGPSASSGFLSIVESPGAYPLTLIVAAVAAIVSYWKWK